MLPNFSSKSTKISTKKLLLLLLALALSLRCYFFFISVNYIPTTTDEALAVLIAKAINKGKLFLLFWGAPYQFPAESYLMSPFVNLFPRNAFGARFMLGLLGLSSLFGFSYLLKKIERFSLAFLLILFPSAYILTLQSSYFIPEYTFTLTAAWVLPLLYYLHLERKSVFLILLIGFLAGFSLSTHLLSLPLVAVLSILICLGNSYKKSLKTSFSYITSLLLGLTPYLLSVSETSEFASTITGSYSISKVVERFFSSIISGNLSTLLGHTICPLPDLGQVSGVLPTFITKFFLCFFWLLLISLSIYLLLDFIKRVKAKKHFDFNIYDLLVGTIWASLLAFAFSKRGDFTEFRYLLHVAWYFPFLIALGLKISKDKTKYLLLFFVACSVLINLANSTKLLAMWQKDDFAEKNLLLPQLDDTIEFLEKKNFKHCYATFWNVNRLTYQTDERITCSQAFNERFPGWHLPYESLVDNSSRAAYVYTENKFSRHKVSHLNAQLKYVDIEFLAKRFKDIFVFYGFSYKELSSEGLYENFKLASSNFTYDKNQSEIIIPIKNLLSSESESIKRIVLQFENKLKEKMIKNSDFLVSISKDKKSWQSIDFKLIKNIRGIYIKKYHPIYSSYPSLDFILDAGSLKKDAKYIKIEKLKIKPVNINTLIGLGSKRQIIDETTEN